MNAQEARNIAHIENRNIVGTALGNIFQEIENEAENGKFRLELILNNLNTIDNRGVSLVQKEKISQELERKGFIISFYDDYKTEIIVVDWSRD